MKRFNIIATFLELFFAPMFAFASQQGTWYQLFKANVQHVLGEHPAHSILSGMTRSESGGGEGTWLNAIDAKASADAGGFSEIEGENVGESRPYNFNDVPTVKKFQQADGDFDAYKETLTPFNDVVKYKTYSEPQVNEWGHSFQAAEDTWQNLTDPKSTVISVGMQKMHRRTDVLMGKAVVAPEVGRRIDGDTLANVPLPDSQVIADIPYSEANVNTVPTIINEIMGNAWFTRGMPIYCAISTKLATAMKTNSEQGDKLRSTDFIASYDQFRNGVIPTVEGVTFIELPYEFMQAIKPNVTGGTGEYSTVDHYFAWSPQAIAKVDYQALGTQIGVDPNRRFYTAAYVSEYVDYKRTDDLGVVVGDIRADSVEP